MSPAVQFVIAGAVSGAFLSWLGLVVMRKIGIAAVMKSAAEAKGESAAAMKYVREMAENLVDLRRSNLEVWKLAQALSHEIEDIKIAHQIERDWMQAHSRATRGGVQH